MVVAKAVASSGPWKPARELRRLPLSWERGYVAAKQVGDHPQRTVAGGSRSAKPRESYCTLKLLPLCMGVGDSGERGLGGVSYKATDGHLSPLADQGGHTMAGTLDSLTPMAVPRKTIKGLC